MVSASAGGDATQNLVDDEITLSHGQSCAGCLLALGYARRATPRTWTFHERPGVSHTATIRPPVSPEVREEMFRLLYDASGSQLMRSNERHSMVTEQRDALLARFSVPSRPPVGPEVREEVRAVVGEQLTKAGLDLNGPPYSDDGETQWPVALELRDCLTAALLARFSVPSQPVYDEEKIARFLTDARYPEGLWMSGSREPREASDEEIAAALVAALRGGELTREETNG